MATSTIIALLLQGNCTDAQIDSFLQRVTDAQQKGHDAFGLTTDQLQAMLQKIIQKYTYNNTKNPKQTKDKIFEGETLQKVIGSLTGIEVPYPSSPAVPLATEIDGVTAYFLLEITRGDGGDKVAQLAKYWQADVAEFGSRPMVFYGPNIGGGTARAMILREYALASGGASVPIYVINSAGITTNDPNLVDKLNKLGIDIPVYYIDAQGITANNIQHLPQNNYQPVPAPVASDASLNAIMNMLSTTP